MRSKLFKLSGISAAMAVIVFVINYFFYHFVTDEGISTVFNPEAGKPFVADLIGQLGIHFVFLAIASFLIALVVFPKKDEK